MAKTLIKESARLLEALPDGANGEKVFKVVLITEGLGNLRNKNFYGPEAIESAAKVYEGKSCYINHQDAIEEETLPERDIRDKAGYYKNMAVVTLEGGKACIGELHCDLSESGRFLAEKVQSALKYKKDFPDNGMEYCGFSVNGDGDAEKRTMTIAGESMAVNYVTLFTDDSESCDLVTTPARGGKAVSVIRESEVKNHSKENVMKEKLKKMLEAAFNKVTESAKKLTGDAKNPLLEAGKAITEAIKTVEAEAGEAPAMEADIKALFDKKENESESDHVARLTAIKKMVDELLPEEKAEMPQEAGDEVCPEDGEEEKPAPVESARKPLTADELERNLIAVKFLVKESGLPEDCYSESKITQLSKMAFSKAKALIESDAKLAAAILKESGFPVASLHRADKETGSNKNAFTESFKKENN